MKHLFIVNPVAGGVKGNRAHIETEIDKLTEKVSNEVEVYVTKGPLDAVSKIKQVTDSMATDGIGLYVYACGGDGTLNECVNGAAGRRNVAVTHYPCGTGNDFLKTFAAQDRTYSPESITKFRDLPAMMTGAVKHLDIIECAVSSDECDNYKRYGINICSVGIDARIGTDVHKYSKLPLIGGKMGYNVSLLVNVIKGIAQHFRVTARGIVDEKGKPADDIVFDRKLTLACACNGRYYGGGFNPVPDALPDDGFLDCLVVEPVSRLKVAEIVGKFAKGRFAEFPEVFNYAKCKELEIETNREFVVNIDGEGVYAKKIVFRIIPKGINFLFPKGFDA